MKMIYNPKVYDALKKLESTRAKITRINDLPIDKMTSAMFKRLDRLYKQNMEAWKYLADMAQKSL